MLSFRARARTIDMLGRQQIAGIPTAISELFKNAYDAYATDAVVDFFRADGLFVLRDNGIGMSPEDFRDRWLTLGTESKVADGGMPLLRPPKGESRRRSLGEKGIGRLAIASIGPQVLVLTRARQSAAPCTSAFINWTLFSCPGINLDDIEVPVTETNDGVPDAAAVRQLVDRARDNLERVRSRIGTRWSAQIVRELSDFVVDPVALDAALGDPRLTEGGHGVHFVIKPTDPTVAADVDERPETDEASPLRRVLLGFANTMTPGHPDPKLRVSFRDHRAGGDPDELIGDDSFFVPEEFSQADHHITGDFDSFGQFDGTVGIYGAEPKRYTVSWPGATGEPTQCGPFRVNIAYLQGAQRESRLPPAQWAELSRKLLRIGGLYVYRDGVRVLPYGSTDFDWLDIEKNRTKSAAYYFFSYRRIFGVVELTGEENAGLTEKAGREGFRTNLAYRQFSEILKRFFVQVAADFFRPDGPMAEEYSRQKEELNRVETSRRRREQQVGVRRREFETLLGENFRRISDAEPESEAAQVVEIFRRAMGATADAPVTDKLAAETGARRQLEDLREGFMLTKPRGVALSKPLRRDWAAMAEEMARLERDVFATAEAEIERLAVEASAEAADPLERRRRFDRLLAANVDGGRRSARSESQLLTETATAARDRVVAVAREGIERVRTVTEEVLAEAARTDLAAGDEVTTVASRQALEARVNESVNLEVARMEDLRARLDDIVRATDEGASGAGMDEVTAAIEEELLDLRERSDADLDLTQLGMALQVVNHEFESSIKSVRSNLNRLRPWADKNAQLAPLYEGIRTSFEHLDGYLTLFTPLQRRMYRRPVEIAGSEILSFLRDLFQERLLRHGVDLQATKGFAGRRFKGYPSTFYPVFVNLVDNAIYWVGERRGKRRITLGTDGMALVVRDTGPGVRARDAQAIFELGFSRKPGGRGLGLHISREVLRRQGWDLTVRTGDPTGATFVLSPLPSEEGED